MSNQSIKEDSDEFNSISDEASKLLDGLNISGSDANSASRPETPHREKSQGSIEKTMQTNLPPSHALVALVFIIVAATTAWQISEVPRQENLARQRAAREQAAREQAAREQAAREQAAREQAAREKILRDNLEVRGQELSSLGWYKVSNNLYFRWCNSGSTQQVKGEYGCAPYRGNTPYYATGELYCIGNDCSGEVVGAVYQQKSNNIVEKINAGKISLGREERSVVYFPSQNNGTFYLQRAGNYCRLGDGTALAPCRDGS